MIARIAKEIAPDYESFDPTHATGMRFDITGPVGEWDIVVICMTWGGKPVKMAYSSLALTELQGADDETTAGYLRGKFRQMVMVAKEELAKQTTTS